MSKNELFEVNIKYDNSPIAKGKMKKKAFKDLLDDLNDKFK